MALMIAILAGGGVGCAHTAKKRQIHSVANMPKELDKKTHPVYVIEPPDVLQVDLIAIVPLASHQIQPQDVLSITAQAPLPESPLNGLFLVDLEGNVNLGETYSTVKVRGLTIAEAKVAIEKHLKNILKNPTATVTLAQVRAVQQVRGPHLVRADGTIGLGTYGSVAVVGMTIAEAKKEIERYLGQFFQDPEISLDVTGFNSKVYYIIFDGGGAGQQMVRAPVTGNETVLDAIGQISGLSAIADSRKIWITRPTRAACNGMTILPVDWKAITEVGDTATNYQILPGDRLFVKALPAVTILTRLSQILAPIERALGFGLLVQGIGNNNNNNNGF